MMNDNIDNVQEGNSIEAAAPATPEPENDGPQGTVSRDGEDHRSIRNAHSAPLRENSVILSVQQLEALMNLEAHYNSGETFGSPPTSVLRDVHASGPRLYSMSSPSHKTDADNKPEGKEAVTAKSSPWWTSSNADAICVENHRSNDDDPEDLLPEATLPANTTAVGTTRLTADTTSQLRAETIRGGNTSLQTPENEVEQARDPTKRGKSSLLRKHNGRQRVLAKNIKAGTIDSRTVGSRKTSGWLSFLPSRIKHIDLEAEYPLDNRSNTSTTMARLSDTPTIANVTSNYEAGVSMSIPGAIAVKPSGQVTLTLARLTRVSSRELEVVHENTVNNAGDSYTTDLVEAMPVAGQSARRIIPEALEVDLDQPDRQEKDLLFRRIGYCFILVAVFFLTLSAGVYLGVKGGKKLQISAETPTALSPTGFVSNSPTEVASSAPTGELDLFTINLPSNTQQRIQVRGSPQWQAWEWLSNHQNNSNLPEWRKIQLFALATFFYSFEGPNWYGNSDWLNEDRDECNWLYKGFGTFCQGSYAESLFPNSPCNKQGEYTEIILICLQLENLKPVIPPEIALLTSLQVIEFASNEINANLTVWTEMGLMTSLSYLDLHQNDFSGWLPSEVALMTSLEFLHLHSNSFSGWLPSEIGMINSLWHLHLFSNSLTGWLPTEVGMMTSLGDLSLYHNDFRGWLPSEIGEMASLESLVLHNNAFSGWLPTEIGMMTSLWSMSLHDNTFSGWLPSELGLMTTLECLHLFNNAISFWLPSELGLMAALDEVDLNNNNFSGILPTEIGMMASLHFLFLNNNAFSGWLPSELGWLTSLYHIEVCNNRLYGWLPTELGLMTSLFYLYLHDNDFSGILPTELGMMTRLSSLQLHNNKISGWLPSELGSMRSLQELRIGNNSISGTLPSELRQLTRLEELDLSNLPLLTGSIASGLSLLTNLGYLDLRGCHKLSGTIPESICYLQNDACSYGLHNDKNCALTFDCTDTLCGCDCRCSST